MKKICMLLLMVVSLTSPTLFADGKALNPLDFGAKGDGVADDTEAFNKIDAAIAAYPGAVEVIIPGGNVFMVNPLKAPLQLRGGKMVRRCLIMLRSDYSKVSGSGLIKIIKGLDYTEGMKNGQEWYWSVVLIRASHCTVDGLNFSGNGTGTYKGHIAKQPNIRWEGVSAFGALDKSSDNNYFVDTNYHVGNKIVNCLIVEGGGQAMAIQWQKRALIANNVVEDSSGMGFSRCDDSIMIGNISTRSHDAPYYVNGNCNNIIVANNISHGTTNGSGIDIVGAFNVIVTGNVIENSAAHGIHVAYSGQQKCPSRNVLVKGNVFVRNCRSDDTAFNGEINVGTPWPSGAGGRINASDITIEGNKIVLDGVVGPSTAYNKKEEGILWREAKGHFLRITHGAERVQVVNNTISGTLNPLSEVISVDDLTTDLVIRGNIWAGEGSPLAYIYVNPVGGGVKGIFDFAGNHRIELKSK